MASYITAKKQILTSMKQYFFFLVFLIFTSCKEPAVKQPDHLIEREEMVNLLYDLSVLEVVKYQNPPSLKNYKKDLMGYIYKKYKIDSLQFVQNNRYYASDYKDYKKMYEEIKVRIDTEVHLLDSLKKLNDRRIKKDSLKRIVLKKKLLLKAKKLKAKLLKEKLAKKAKDSISRKAK